MRSFLVKVAWIEWCCPQEWSSTCNWRDKGRSFDHDKLTHIQVRALCLLRALCLTYPALRAEASVTRAAVGCLSGCAQLLGVGVDRAGLSSARLIQPARLDPETEQLACLASCTQTVGTCTASCCFGLPSCIRSIGVDWAGHYAA